MHFRDSKSYTPLAEGLEQVLGVYCCRRFAKYIRLLLWMHLAYGSIIKEFPDRMMATFSVLPSPKVDTMLLVGTSLT
jgi:hypothetical protein